MRAVAYLCLLAIVWLTIVLLPGCGAKSPVSQPLKKVVVAVSQLASSTPLYLARARGYFQAEGLEVELQEHNSGRSSLLAMLDGKADYAACAETPFMSARLNGAQVWIIATLCTSSFNNCILAPKNGPIQRVPDLRGKRVAVATGTSGEFMLDTALLYHHVKAGDVVRVNGPPDQLAALLESGAADAVATWDPYAQRAIQAAGESLQRLPGVNQNTWHWCVTAREEAVKDVTTSAALLRALKRAIDDINADKNSVRDSGLRPDTTFSDERFQLALPQSLVLNLEIQAEWARGRGYIKAPTLPNVLDWIDTSAMDVENRNSVSIIR